MKLSTLTDKQYKINFGVFVWHALFLALMKPFLDTDTIIPAMILKSGGNEVLIGFATAILIGFGTLFQFFFGAFVSHKIRKKSHLLLAINIRVLSILGLGFVLLFFNLINQSQALVLIFILISMFSIAGAYGGVSYMDLVGKTIKIQSRKALFSIKSLIGAIGFFAAAFVAKKVLNLYNFPLNYSYLYLIAAVLLFIASLGLWTAREKLIIPSPKKSFSEFVKIIPSELRKNKNLKYYLIIINTLGLSITAFPFLVSYAKEISGITNEKIGNFLIMKVAGMVSISLLVYFIHKKINYKTMLIIATSLGVLVPIFALIFAHNNLFYSLNFFIAGSMFGVFRIAREGIIIEISNEKNRAEYAGIAGAGSLFVAVLPMFSGFFISQFGYKIVFICIAIIVLLSLFFTMKLKCK